MPKQKNKVKAAEVAISEANEKFNHYVKIGMDAWSRRRTYQEEFSERSAVWINIPSNGSWSKNKDMQGSTAQKLEDNRDQILAAFDKIRSNRYLTDAGKKKQFYDDTRNWIDFKSLSNAIYDSLEETTNRMYSEARRAFDRSGFYNINLESRVNTIIFKGGAHTLHIKDEIIWAIRKNPYNNNIEAFESDLKNRLIGYFKEHLYQNIDEDAYFYKTYKPVAGTEPASIIAKLKDDTRLDTLDLSNFHPLSTSVFSKEHLAEIPAHIHTVSVDIKTMEAWNQKEAIKYFAFLPPQVKTISLESLSKVVNYDRDRWGQACSKVMPFAVKRLMNEDKSLNLNKKIPDFPASYLAMFDIGINNTPSTIQNPVVRGMHQLLRHYMGSDDPSVKTRFRCMFRDHKDQVAHIIDQIENNTITTPLELLAALKSIEPANSRGGLQARTHFLSHYLVENPPENPPAYREDEDEDEDNYPQAN